MTKQYDDIDLLGAVAGTVGALEVAGRYAWGGFQAVGRHVRWVGGPARRAARHDARLAGRRAVAAMRVRRGTARVPSRGPMDVIGPLAAAAVTGVVTVVGIRYISRGLVGGEPVPPPAPPDPEAARSEPEPTVRSGFIHAG